MVVVEGTPNVAEGRGRVEGLPRGGFELPLGCRKQKAGY